MAGTPVGVESGMGVGDWVALAFVVGLIALWVGLQIAEWRERRSWRVARRAPENVTRTHGERSAASQHQRAA